MNEIPYEEAEINSALNWLKNGWKRFEKHGYLTPDHFKAQKSAGKDYTIIVKSGKMHLWYSIIDHKILDSRSGRDLSRLQILKLAEECSWPGYSRSQFANDQAYADKAQNDIGRIWPD